MAKISFDYTEKFGRVLGYWETRMLDDNALKRVVKRGTAIIADALRYAVENLPVAVYQRGTKERNVSLQQGYETCIPTLRGATTLRGGVTKREKKLMLKHFGVTPIKRDRDGFLHAKIGWDGYTTHPKKGFPKGFPVPFMVAIIESGTSRRSKIPFIRKTVKKYESAAVEEMQKALDEELDDIFNFEGRT